MIDYMQLHPSESERLCYAEGFRHAAELFARIADLSNELENAHWEIDMLKIELDKERAK
jgi:hypothetical protein